ncbi:YccS family putative transporter [Ottowia massiliensis]|uniref:YccS family putative transporter n=1 Tax=Ottowia massiliensis TaxID=2045302 RepID=UPI000C858291|nr:YccS family putative transporter [Ottowia massiliensis]
MRTPAINSKVIATLPIFCCVMLACGFVWAVRQPAWTMPLVLGVIAGGLVDLDNGLTGRVQNIVLTALAFSFSSLLVQTMLGTGLPFIVTMTALTFLFTVLGALGLRYRTIAFGALAVATYTTLAYAPQTPWFLNPLLILCGTLLYSSVTLCLHVVFPHRPVQDSMAAAFAELGGYFDAKAAFFDPDEAEWLEDGPRLALARQNTAVINAFNQCRSALFYRMRGQHRHPRTARMLRLYFIAQDVHERISSTHADYRELAESLKNTDLIFRIHRLLELQGQACRDVASSLRADMPYAYSARLQRAMTGCQQSLRVHAQSRQAEQADQAEQGGQADQLHALQRLMDNLAGIDYQLSHIESAADAAFGENSDKTRIAAQEQDGPLLHALRAMRGQLNMRSPVFRHAVRLSLVVALSCTVVELLHLNLGYWILLTALFVCQPNYSATRSRVNQRIGGTIAGVLVGSVVPWFTPTVETKLGIIVLTTTLFFLMRNYKYSWSTFFITIQALTSLSLMGVDIYAAMPVRIIDTITGAAIAWAAVHFLWPDWRYLSLPASASASIASNGAYLERIISQLENGVDDDVAYRSVRRLAHEKAAALSSAISDMSSQPGRHSPQMQGAGLNLLKTSYALIGYISALGAYRSQIAQEARQEASAAGQPPQTQPSPAAPETPEAAAAPQAPEAPEAQAFTPLFFDTARQTAQLLQALPGLDDSAFAAASERIQSGVRALRARVQGRRPNSVLWQQLSLITRQLAPCRQMLKSMTPPGEAGPTAPLQKP